ncbi:MAG: DMT family transporter [Burkholderiaceae bacterium]
MTSHSLQHVARKEFLIGLAIAVTGAVLFSGKAIVAKLIYLYPVDAMTLLAFRMLFSMPVFVGVAIWQGWSAAPLSNPDRIRIVVLGSVGYYLASFLDFLGLQHISAGLERLILFLTPTFVLLLSVFLFKRHISRFEWGALAVSYMGTVFVFIHDVSSGGNNVWLGGAFVLGSAVSYALYLIFCGELLQRVGTLRLVAYAMCVSSVICIGQFLLLRPFSMLLQPLPVYGLSVVNALFCTVLPVFMTMIAVSRIGAGATSLAGMVGPISTLFLAAIILDEPVTGIQLTGTALVLSGMYVLSMKKT